MITVPSPLVRLALVSALLFAPLIGSAKPEQWAKAIDDLTRNDHDQPPAPGGVVFVGSSSIVFWKDVAKDFPGLGALNRGFGGSELADSVFYADRVVIPYRPRAVVLYAGDNDLAAGKAPETVIADFHAFVTKVHGALPAARIVYIAIKPSPSRWNLREKITQVNHAIADACSRESYLRFVDIYAPMLNASGEPRRELFREDMLHMNEAGYALWRPLVAAELAP
jgi:lysophospholipase L1-like esterase